jgi:hypothetical protein
MYAADASDLAEMIVGYTSDVGRLLRRIFGDEEARARAERAPPRPSVATVRACA